MSEDTMEYTDRGFEVFGRVANRYGETEIVESSAASCEQGDGSVTGPWVWIFAKGGSAGGNDGHTHLDVAEARVVRDALQAFITRAENECEWIEPEPRP
jgi:hypothetical protein